MSKIKVWVLASRPKTLLAAFVPVIVGASLAFAERSVDYYLSGIALLCAVLLQLGSNLVNDLFDFLKGTDNEKRLGPKRAAASGLLTTSELKAGIYVVFVTAFLLGMILVWYGGVTIFLIGVLSILAGIAYTAGPFPLAYNGLGDLFAFLFFGVVATVGTYFVNTGEFSGLAFLASVPVGALVTNILVVNNYRDYDNDKENGKFTLIVRLGKNFGKYEYIFMLGCSFLVPLIIFLGYEGISYLIFLPYLLLPFAYKLVLMLFTLSGIQLNKLLELTARFSALYGILFSLGLIL
ncbi:MAG: 1,4-dihydroxy-2-naphthoate polyprenyltransferase [Ignavibacteriaceae bacterium]|nr:1,4-dihydroxy-2-naphthoate polyprenyltransferase [Ignavibacteriaceae bacterium]